MSITQARALVEKMKSDSSLLKEVMSIQDLPGRIRLINKLGFDCNETEIRQIHKEMITLACRTLCVPLVPKPNACPLIECRIDAVTVHD